MKIQPLGDKTLVRPIQQNDTTEGGIIITDGAKERPFEGEVIATGPGRTLASGVTVPTGVQPGDTVIYQRHVGEEIPIDGVKHLLLDSSALLAVKSPL